MLGLGFSQGFSTFNAYLSDYSHDRLVLTFSWGHSPCHNTAGRSQHSLGGKPGDPLIALAAIFRFPAAADRSVLGMTDIISRLVQVERILVGALEDLSLTYIVSSYQQRNLDKTPQILFPHSCNER